MPTFELTAPDNSVYHVDAPDEHSAVAALKQASGGNPFEQYRQKPANPSRNMRRQPAEASQFTSARRMAQWSSFRRARPTTRLKRQWAKRTRRLRKG